MILDRLFRKDTNRALTSADLALILSRGGSSSAGISVNADTAMYLGAVFACARVLSESVGQLPFHLYRQRGRDKEKAKDHPLYSLLHVAPNEWQTAQEWREWVIACLALRGNAYCQIIWVGGSVQRVGELLPIHPGAVTLKQDPKTRTVTYDVTTSGGTRTLSAREVLHIKLFTLDGLVGASPIQYARESIGMSIAMERHGAGLFANGAAPGGVLKHPGKLSESAFNRLRDTWDERHQGAGNAGRTALLEEGATFEKIGLTSVDVQWLEGRKFQRSEIAGLYRVPPHLIGDLERATFGNIEHQSLDFVVHSLMPYLTRIEQRISMQLLSEEERKEYGAKFNVAGLLRGDMAARGQFYTTLVQNGAMSPNEIRELEDRNPREGGDSYLTPSNMLIDGKAPAPAAPAVLPLK